MPTDNNAYHKPKTVKVPPGSGYPQTDIGKDNLLTKGRWPSDTKQKTYGTMRGAGAATKGTKFLDN